MRHVPLFALVIATTLICGGASCSLSRDDDVNALPQIAWELAPASAPADAQSALQIAITLKNLRGEPVAATQVWLQSDVASDHIVQPSATEAGGQAVGQMTASVAGLHTLTAYLRQGFATTPLAARGQAHFTDAAAQPDAAAPADANGGAMSPLAGRQVSIDIEAAHLTAAADPFMPTQLVLVLKDSDGHPLVGQEVFLSTLRPGDVVAPTSGVTDASGRLVVSLTAGSLGAAIVQAQAGSTIVRSSVQVVAGAPDTMQSLWAPSNVQAVADGHDALGYDLLVRDGHGFAVPYAQVTFISGEPTDVLQPASTLTDAFGVAAVRLLGTVAGVREVAAHLHTGPLVAPGTLVAGPPIAARASLMVSPNVVVADGSSPGYLDIAFADQFGNPEQNCLLTLASSEPSDIILPALPTTDAMGLAQVSVTSTVAGNRLVMASCQGLAVQAPVSWVPGPPSNQRSALIASPATVSRRRHLSTGAAARRTRQRHRRPGHDLRRHRFHRCLCTDHAADFR